MSAHLVVVTDEVVALKRAAVHRRDVRLATLTRAVRVTARIVLPSAVSIGLLAAVTGWLYLLRPEVASWPGPSIAALPLGELARHDRIPLFVVLVLLAFAAALAGLAGRAARLGRLTAATVLGLSSGAWSLFQVAASYYVVRQIPFSQALGDAASTPVLYLAAVMPALAGAALGRSRRTGSGVASRAKRRLALVESSEGSTPSRGTRSDTPRQRGRREQGWRDASRPVLSLHSRVGDHA